MSKRWIKAGLTDQTIDIFILDSSSTTGAGLANLTHSSGGLTCYYRKGATGASTALSLATQTATGAHSDGGFCAVDNTNMPGLYRLDLSDTMVAAEGMLTIYLRGATNMAPVVAELEIVDIDIYDNVRLGLTALPNAAAETGGGLATLSAAQNSNGTIPVNVKSIAGQTASASAGVTFPASIGTSTLTAANVWDTDISGYTTAGQAGTYLKNASAPSAATVADAVWDEVLSGHLTSGSTGAALNAAGSAGDPWATTLPGAYGAGTAGKIIGDNINATISSRLASSAITLSSGAVTVGTNNDKTGYSLTQSFPANFASLAITNAGAVTAGTVSDKTGYSLSAGSITASTFGAAAITNSVLASGAISDSTFASNAIGSSAIASGAITAAALATDAANEIADRVWGSSLTANSGSTAWANDTFGKSVLRSYNNANPYLKTTAAGNEGGHVAADVHNIQDDAITAASIATNAITNDGLDTSACTEIWQTDISGYSTAGYAGTYLKNATSDWTADQRTAISAILGIPASGTTPTDPTSGILDTIRDKALDIESDTQDIQNRLPAALVSGRIDASVGAVASGAITNSAFAAGAIDSNALNSSAITEIWEADISQYSNATYAGTYLKNATSDWTADQRTAIRSALGIPASGTTLVSPAIVLAKTTNITGFNDVIPVTPPDAQTIANTVLTTASSTSSSDGTLSKVLAQLNTMIETVPSSNPVNYRFDPESLAECPTASSDWTANERTAIKAILGVTTDSATPGDPTTGILDGIRDRLPSTLVNGRMDSHVGSMGADTVTSSAIATGAIDADSIAAAAITSTKFASAAITGTVIQDGAISANKIGNGAITSGKFAAGAINADAIAAGAITVSEIADGAITGAKIANDAITKIWDKDLSGYTSSTGDKAGFYLITAGENVDPATSPLTADGIADALLSRKLDSSGSISDISCQSQNNSAVFQGNNTFVVGDRVRFLNNSPAGFGTNQDYLVHSSNLTATSFSLRTLSVDTPIVAGESNTFTVVPVEDRTVRSALRYLRNRVNIPSNTDTMTVYREDDQQKAWSSTVVGSTVAVPIVDSNPVGGQS